MKARRISTIPEERYVASSVLHREIRQWEAAWGVKLHGRLRLWEPDEDDTVMQGFLCGWDPDCFPLLRRSRKALLTRIWKIAGRFPGADGYRPGKCRTDRRGTPWTAADRAVIEYATSTAGIRQGAHLPAYIAPVLMRTAKEVRAWMEAQAAGACPAPGNLPRAVRECDLTSPDVSEDPWAGVSRKVFRTVYGSFNKCIPVMLKAVRKSLKAGVK